MNTFIIQERKAKSDQWTNYAVVHTLDQAQAMNHSCRNHNWDRRMEIWIGGIKVVTQEGERR